MSKKEIASVADLKGKTIRGQPDRRSAVQLHERVARQVRHGPARRAVDRRRRRRERPRRGARERACGRDAADAAGVLQGRGSGLQGAREPRRPRRHLRGDDLPDGRSTVAANPRLPEQLIKAHAEAIKRFYDDKAFAVKAYQAYDKQPTADVERFYDGYRRPTCSSACPTCSPAVKAVIEQQRDPQLAAQLKAVRLSDAHRQQHRRSAREGRLLPEAVRAVGSRPKKSARRSWRSGSHAGRVSRRSTSGHLLSATRDSRRAHGSTHHAGRAPRDRGHRDSEAPPAAARAWLPHPDRRRAAPPRLHERLLRLRRWSRQRRVGRARVEGTIRRTGGTTANQVRLAGLVVGKLTQKKRLTGTKSTS